MTSTLCSFHASLMDITEFRCGFGPVRVRRRKPISPAGAWWTAAPVNLFQDFHSCTSFSWGGRWSVGVVCVRTMCVQCRAPPRTLLFYFISPLLSSCRLRVYCACPVDWLWVQYIYPPPVCGLECGCAAPSDAD